MNADKPRIAHGDHGGKDPYRPCDRYGSDGTRRSAGSGSLGPERRRAQGHVPIAREGGRFEQPQPKVR